MTQSIGCTGDLCHLRRRPSAKVTALLRREAGGGPPLGDRQANFERSRMSEEIFGKMKKGVYYPGNHLGKREELARLEEHGLLERMDGSFLCGPDSEPNYRLTRKGYRKKMGIER